MVPEVIRIIGRIVVVSMLPSLTNGNKDLLGVGRNLEDVVELYNVKADGAFETEFGGPRFTGCQRIVIRQTEPATGTCAEINGVPGELIN